MYLLAAIVGVVLPLFCSCAGDETVGSLKCRPSLQL